MTDETEALWSAGLAVVRVLRNQGHDAFLVGGCVRDRLLGRRLHDIDIATSARPEQVTELFRRTIPTGLKHGTVTVLQDGRSFEVTTFRTESGYSDARRPDEVAFVNELREDLARRDFTINAIAVALDGEVIDPFGGRKDLADGIVRCVGDAGRRFGEDALRMLRAIRFAGEFRFGMTLSVWRGIRSQAGRLRHVAMERVGSEWDKAMGGSDPDRACGLLVRSGLLRHVKEPLPDAVMRMNTVDKPEARRAALRRLRGVANTDLRWAVFLVQAGASAEDAGRLCRALRFSGKREARMAAAVAFDRRVNCGAVERSAFVSAVLDYGRQTAKDWLQMIEDAGEFRDWLAELAVDSTAQLAVKGDELSLRLGKPAGPWVALLLRRLLEEVAQGRLTNEKNALIRASVELETTR